MPRKKKEEKEIIINDEQEQNIKEIIIEKGNGFSLLEVIIVMIIAAISGILIGTVVTGNGMFASNEARDLNEFNLTYNELVDTYYEDLNTKELIDAAIEGMFNYLNDPNSIYITEEATTAFEEQVNGTYAGVGMEIYISAEQVLAGIVFEDTPAEEAGFEKGDIILTVDDKTLLGLTSTEVADLIKGDPGSKVKIKYIDITANEEKIVELERTEVDIPSVTSSITTISQTNQKIGEITIDVFAENTKEQFEENLLELEKKEIDSLIIDVRSNPGGSLEGVLEIVSLFVGKKEIVYQLETKGEIEKVYSTNDEFREYDIVVLINKSSASASEILAAALKESYGATIIGTTSFGKGTVQQAMTLSSGATIKYTTQKWLTPKGNTIDGVGIIPDEEVTLNQSYYENPIKENDNQLQRAREILTK